MKFNIKKNKENILLTNHDYLLPFDDVEAARDKRHADCGAHNAVSARDGQIENGGDDEPDAAAGESAYVAEHELELVALKYFRVHDALANRARHLGADEYGAQYFEYGGQNARLLERENFGADAGAERVGDVVGADAERQYECDDEAGYDEQEGRVSATFQDHPLFSSLTIFLISL